MCSRCVKNANLSWREEDNEECIKCRNDEANGKGLTGYEEIRDEDHWAEIILKQMEVK